MSEDPVAEKSDFEESSEPQTEDAYLPVPLKEKSLSVLTPLQHYLHEISQFRTLSAEEEYDLAVRLREEDDQDAGMRLITSNLSLVVKIARIYSRIYHNVIDLIQEGNIGLMEAVKRFDPYKGNRLPTYASWWIKAYIIKFVIDNFRIVRVGTTNERRRLLFNLKKEKEKLRMQGIEPTPQLIAKNLNVTVEDVEAVEPTVEGGDLSLDAPIKGEEDLHYIDTFKTAEEQVDDSLARGELKELLNQKLEEFSKTLSKREYMILHERLVAENPVTLQEIADQFGVTREAIRLTEKALVNKIKIYMMRALEGVTDVEIALLT
jgi:RNA polymerase sigma-32 factor